MRSVEAICIGDELLEGRVRDANAAALGRALAEHGVTLDSVSFVPDDVPRIVAALKGAEADLVVISGGLGPTDDDFTREAAAEFARSPLELHEPSLDWIRRRFEARGSTFTDNNLKQAMLPLAAKALPTEVGTAPGFQLDAGETTFMFFPGVPREFGWFVERYVLEAIGPATNVSRGILQFHGIGESMLETKIADLATQARSRGVRLGYRAEYPLIEVKLAGPMDAVSEGREQIAERLREFVVGEDDQPLPARLGALLLERGETLATAESCTAGGIAALITEVSGSSAWFGRGYVTYANEAKMEELGVLESVLLAHGAVSAQTVCQMAAGARKRARATHAVAVSGIAGPGGGTPDKPVGTVHFGIATPRGTYHRHVVFPGDRSRVRIGTAYRALAFVLAVLEDRAEVLGAPYDESAVWAAEGIPVRSN